MPDSSVLQCQPSALPSARSLLGTWQCQGSAVLIWTEVVAHSISVIGLESRLSLSRWFHPHQICKALQELWALLLRRARSFFGEAAPHSSLVASLPLQPVQDMGLGTTFRPFPSPLPWPGESWQRLLCHPGHTCQNRAMGEENGELTNTA